MADATRFKDVLGDFKALSEHMTLVEAQTAARFETVDQSITRFDLVQQQSLARLDQMQHSLDVFGSSHSAGTVIVVVSAIL